MKLPTEIEHTTGGGLVAPPCSLLSGDSWRLELGDSLEAMKQMKDGAFHAVVTDPPYMIGAISTGDAKSKAGSWVDLMNAAFWYRHWMGECWRILKDGGYFVVFTNWRTVPMLMKACADAKIATSSLAVWDKEWIGPAGPAQLRPTYEMMLFCGKGSAKIPNRSQSDIFREKWMAGNMAQSGHPAQKPVPLLRKVIELITEPGQSVFDPFTGSGTTGIAALQIGRTFHGFEGDDAHFTTAGDRLRNAGEPLNELFTENADCPVSGEAD
jgi:site-specific DNA-methyltransferase (adenine-specific)